MAQVQEGLDVQTDEEGGRWGGGGVCVWGGVRGAASTFYLEIMELDCDWLEEVVAALSWEKPLWLDSRLVMEPLRGETRGQLRGPDVWGRTHAHTEAQTDVWGRTNSQNLL